MGCGPTGSCPSLHQYERGRKPRAQRHGIPWCGVVDGRTVADSQFEPRQCLRSIARCAMYFYSLMHEPSGKASDTDAVLEQNNKIKTATKSKGPLNSEPGNVDEESISWKRLLTILNV